MNTTIQALQALYVKLGGSLTDTYSTIANGVPVSDYTTIPDMIEACTQKAGSGGGSALPAVTAEDNDKLLTVVNGAWDKAEAPAGTFFVTLTITGEDTATSDKTHEEIYAAFEAGQQIVFKFIMDGVPVIIPAYMVDSTNEIIAGILENIESHSGLTYGVRIMASSTSSNAFRLWRLESGIFYFSYTSEDGTNWTSSESFSTIRTAHENGLLVRARAYSGGTTMIGELTSISSSEIEFCHINAESNYIEVTKFTHSSSEVITVLNKQIT